MHAGGGEPKQERTKARGAAKQEGPLLSWIHGSRRGVKQEPHETPARERPENLLAGGRRIPHNNQTGKWVTLFRACWNQNPELEPHFSIGSMHRHAEIYAQDGRLLTSLYDPDYITAIPAVIAMHPTIPGRLATGNVSGKCALWAPPSDA